MHSLRIDADLKELERMRRFVETQTAALNVDPSAVYDVLLAVNEMVTNIIVHGYRGESGSIEVDIRPDGGDLVARLRDRSPPFDPTLVPAPDTTMPLHLRPPGGMGVHLARRLMDSMAYQVAEHGGNELTLVKRGVVTPDT
jgi:serine/threonine-protein kinase RsbW